MNRLTVLACTVLSICALGVAAEDQGKGYSVSQGGYTLQLEPLQALQLNQLHSWRAVLSRETPSAQWPQLQREQLMLSGGMPAHGHGLPTQPKVSAIESRSETELQFVIRGLKFQMWGNWVLGVQLPEMAQPLQVSFELAP
ncbi:MAG: hypothetical protein ACPG4U_04460 [Pseudomonadales bacterium]